MVSPFTLSPRPTTTITRGPQSYWPRPNCLKTGKPGHARASPAGARLAPAAAHARHDTARGNRVAPTALVGTGGILFATSTDHLSTSAPPPRNWTRDPT